MCLIYVAQQTFRECERVFSHHQLSRQGLNRRIWHVLKGQIRFFDLPTGEMMDEHWTISEFTGYKSYKAAENNTLQIQAGALNKIAYILSWFT